VEEEEEEEEREGKQEERTLWESLSSLFSD